MAKIAIWCRHTKDSIIGIAEKIPWHVKSDFQRFRRLTEGKTVLVGENTYNSLPNRTLPNRTIYVATFDRNFQLSDNQAHQIISGQQIDLLGSTKDVYICGGAGIYRHFFSKDDLLPEIVIDCEYLGQIDNLQGQIIDIADCVGVLQDQQKYQLILQTIEDNVKVNVYKKRGFNSTLELSKSIVQAIEHDDVKLQLVQRVISRK